MMYHSTQVIPQSICTRYGLVFGANIVYLVRVLMVICYPIDFPIGKILDCLLGHSEALFRRAQIKALVSIHGQEAGKGGELTHDETIIISGALDLTAKVKTLLTVRPKTETPVGAVSIRRIPRIPADMPLYDILNEFQKGHSHIAAVVKVKTKSTSISPIMDVEEPENGQGDATSDLVAPLLSKHNGESDSTVDTEKIYKQPAPWMQKVNITSRFGI